jgi:SAM-dependent methyltransferase
MSEFQIQQCPACNEEEFSPFLTCTDFFVSGEQFEIKQCNGCGLKITINANDEKSIGKYYQSEEYISHSNTSKGVVNFLYHQVREYMLGRKRRLVEKAVEMKGSLLDVGAGTGFFLNEMKEKGWQVAGTEKSSDARSFAKKEFGLNIKNAENLFQFDDHSFDVITLWHVLEHIHQLSENMEAFWQLLKQDGRLIIAVPNHTSYDARHYGEYWAAWDVPRHLWHFGPIQMKQLAEKYGFHLQKMHTMPFDAFYVSILSERYKKSNLPLIKGFLNGKISWFISLLNRSRSSSVIYVFGKKN